MKKIRRNIFLVIRGTLVLAALLNVAVVVYALMGGQGEPWPEIISQHSKNIESMFWAMLTFVLTYGSTFVEKRQQIDLPDILEIIIVIFTFAGLFLSIQFNLYYTYFWWDDLLHTLSGVIMGFIGFIVIYKINYKYNMDLNPLLVMLFSFSFAVTLGVVWEMMEFTCDAFIGSAHQKWDLPETEILLGRPFQGSGLRDTMSDLIVDSLGALIASLIAYRLYKHEKKRVLETLGKIVAQK